MSVRGLATAPVALAMAASLSLIGCSSGPTGARYAGCAEPMAEQREAALPADLPLIEDVELTDVTRREGFVAVSAVAAGRTVDDLYGPLVEAVSAEGFDLLGQENEGFEAEVYFARRTEVAGIASLRRGPCPGQVTVSIMYDPLETDRGKQATQRVRKASAPDG